MEGKGSPDSRVPVPGVRDPFSTAPRIVSSHRRGETASIRPTEFVNEASREMKRDEETIGSSPAVTPTLSQANDENAQFNHHASVGDADQTISPVFFKSTHPNQPDAGHTMSVQAHPTPTRAMPEHEVQHQARRVSAFHAYDNGSGMSRLRVSPGSARETSAFYTPGFSSALSSFEKPRARTSRGVEDQIMRTPPFEERTMRTPPGTPSMTNTSVAGHASVSFSEIGAFPEQQGGRPAPTSVSSISRAMAEIGRTPPGDDADNSMKHRRQKLPTMATFSPSWGAQTHRPIDGLKFELTRHPGVLMHSEAKEAFNSSGAYFTCIRLTPAVPSTGRYCAILEVTRQGNGAPRKDHSLDGVYEGCGSFIGVCDPERHDPFESRVIGSEYAWGVSLRTGTRFHNGKGLPAPYAMPASVGSVIAVMMDMDNRVTRIHVDGDTPGATFNGVPNAPGGTLCIAVDLCRGDSITIV